MVRLLFNRRDGSRAPRRLLTISSTLTQNQPAPDTQVAGDQVRRAAVVPGVPHSVVAVVGRGGFRPCRSALLLLHLYVR